MATTWIKLNKALFGFAANTTLVADDTVSEVEALINSGLATVVANPGGTPPTFTLGGERVTAGAQASAVKVNAEGANDTAGSVTVTALATGMAAGALFTVTFGTAYKAVPRAVLVHERGAVAVGAYVSAKSATGFTVSSRSAATASQVIPVDFHVIP